MGLHPLISVITPVYNGEKFIGECIQKVQKQTFRGFEHIIMDGVSKDNTVAIVKKYTGDFQNVILHSEKDKGIYDAMNKGIALAKGEWLFFLGCDDYFFEEDVLEKVAAFIAANPQLQLIYGNVWYEKLARLYDGAFGIEKILKHNICHQSIFYHKKVFEISGSYNLLYKIEADYEFNLRCWLGGKIRHSFIPLTVAFFADGGFSATARDANMVANYPEMIVQQIRKGNWLCGKKINLLSKAFRKIWIREGFKKMLATGFKTQGASSIDFIALFWMFVSLPYYIIKRA